MKQILQDMSTGVTTVTECPAPSAGPGSVRVCTRLSLISPGTERMLVDFGKASYLNKARQQPEKVKQVIEKVGTDGLTATIDAVRSKLSQPLPLGYSNVGIVDELGRDVHDFKIGDRVVSNGAHSDIVVVKKNLCIRIPDNVDNESASFTVVASIALQGVRLALPTIGEAFVVIGAGVIGLLTVQILRANGCRVLAVDFDEEKLMLAKSFGAEVLRPGEGDEYLSKADSFSRGKGVDGVIITASTKSNDPIKQAARMCRQRGRVILVGVIGLDLDRADFYEKEISFQVSCSYGPGRYDPDYEEKGHDYPIGFVRWTEKRNFEAVLDMMASGLLDVYPLITSRYDFLDAKNAYEELTKNPSGLGILLDYQSDDIGRLERAVDLATIRNFSSAEPVVGFIGAGNYASRVLMPAFKKAGCHLHTVVTSSGINSVIHGKRMGFRLASTDIDAMLSDKSINTAVIVTQHHSHADFVIKCLKAGKNVWVEKPLCIDMESLVAIESAYNQAHGATTTPGPQLMVGFNRRFAPQVQKMHQLLSGVSGPKSFIMTINAGYIPDEHWTQDLSIGGGRIIGEACHFIDLMRFLAGSKIISTQTRGLGQYGGQLVQTDSASITLGFEDGSFGTILYFANGSSKFPKERIEAFADGRILQLDNFRRLTGYGWSNFRKMNLFSQNKGQDECASKFVSAIKDGTCLIPSEEIFEVTRVAIEASASLLRQ